jgi:hypothetical protein
MALDFKKFTVVSTDGSSLGVDTAYLVSSDLVIGKTHAERSQLAVDNGLRLLDFLQNDKPPFVSKCVMYKIEGWTYDDDRPEFQYLIPMHSGNFWVVDCWIVDEEGNVHPGYNVAGVPVATSNFVAVDDSPRIMD